MTREAMLAAFADEELHTFQGQGGKTLTYIEDETVMDRLDLGFGPGNWSIQVEPFPYVEGVVKVRLGIRPHDEWIYYEDFGYPNNKGGQELKEAVSDGIRRCGRYIGIARDLYRKTDETPGRPVGRPAPPRLPVTPARPHVVDTSVPEADDEDWLPPADAKPRIVNSGTDTTTCPIHDAPWAGSPGDLFHKDGDKWCRHPDNVRKARTAR